MFTNFVLHLCFFSSVHFYSYCGFLSGFYGGRTNLWTCSSSLSNHKINVYSTCFFLFRLRQIVGGLWFESIKECGTSVCINFPGTFHLASLYDVYQSLRLKHPVHSCELWLVPTRTKHGVKAISLQTWGLREFEALLFEDSWHMKELRSAVHTGPLYTAQ
jgi:hypothetical protein